MDVTEHKGADDALRESEARFRTMADTAPVLIWMSGLDKRCTYFNKIWLDFTGRSVAQELGDGWREGVHPDDYECCLSSYAEAFDARQEFEMEYRLRRADGAYRWILDRGAPRFLTDGSFAGYIGSCIDITERKRVKAELHARARQQAAVAELGQVALDGATLDALFERAVTLTAQTLEVAYCKVLELLPGGEKVRLRAGVGWREGLVGVAKVSTGTESQAGYTLLSSEPVVVADLRTETRFSGPPLLHEHGVVSGMSVVIRGQKGPFGVLGAHTAARRDFSRDDVNFFQAVANVLASAVDHYQKEELLRRRNQEFAALVERAPDVTARFDRDLRHLYVSPAIERITGIAPKNYIGKTNQELGMAGELFSFWRERLLAIFKTGNDDTFEFDFITPEGVLTYHSRAVPEFNDRGEVETVLVVSRDITERKQAEKERGRLLAREREARAKAEEAGRRLSFLAEASKALASSLDYETTLTNVAQLAVPHIADWCAIDLVEGKVEGKVEGGESGTLTMMALAHVDPHKVQWGRELRLRYPADLNEAHGVAKVLRTGQAEFYP
ncbi:MAG: PAS domain S-box protein, partial [Deinococcota bacterium]|nr:PAS domain S-box protein [Deinococcota bacterium]